MELLAQLHPRMVHFPVALLFFYILTEFLGVISRKEFFRVAALYIMAAGVLTAIPALISGNQASETALRMSVPGSPEQARLKEIIGAHEQWATVAVWYFTAFLAFRIWLFIQTRVKKRFADKEKVFQYLFLALGILGCFFIYRTGSYGGELVYKNGIGTTLYKRDIIAPEKK